MSLITNFIMTNKDWRLKLESSPYNLKITEDENYWLFKYSQLNSDFSIPLVQEARGIIIDKNTSQVAGRGFNKFFNLGEPNAANIDWGSASILEKEDGSIIKVWYDKYTTLWRISTNGGLDARNVEVPYPQEGIENFYTLVMRALENHGVTLEFITSMVPIDYTIVLEVMSPYNKVIINHDYEHLSHLTTIENKTGKEIDLIIGLPKPDIYPLTTLEETIEACEKLNSSLSEVYHEGFVVKDKFNNHIKIKNEKYLKLHYMRGEGVFTNKKAWELIQSGEENEFLTYFPESKKIIKRVNDRLKEWKQELSLKELWFKTEYLPVSKKDFANLIKDDIDAPFLFKLYDNSNLTIDKYISSLTRPYIFRRLKL